MPKRIVCLTFTLALALTAPAVAQGRNDDSDLRFSRAGTSPITRIIKAVKRAVLDLAYEITVPHP